MAILDKFKFWKKDEGFGMPADFSPPPDVQPQGFASPNEPVPGVTESFGKDALVPPVEPQSFGEKQSFQQPGFSQAPSFGQQAPGFQQPSPQFQQQFAAPSSDQQLQLISAKLDTIRAQLETVLQRLDRLERKEEHPYQQRWRTGM